MRLRVFGPGCRIASALAALACSVSAPTALADDARSCPGKHWVASWTASPSHASTARSALSRQTLRMIVAPHLGGAKLRLRLSNRYRTEPVTLDHVTVASRGSGAAIVAGSSRDVTFRGSRRITIPAGGDAYSDPVGIRIKPFEKLAVSVYLAGLVARPTEHFVTRQTSYATAGGAGDRTQEETGFGFAPTRTAWSNGWAFLNGVDVVAPARWGAVVAFGDSITDGFEGSGNPLVESFASLNRNARYPDLLQRRLLAAGRRVSVVNAGISGNKLLQDSDPDSPIPAGVRAIARLDDDALEVAGATHVLMLEGINDLADGATSTEVIRALSKVMKRVRARGMRVILGTLTPAGGASGWKDYGSPETDAARRRVNRWIRTGARADGVVDFDAALRDARDESRLAPRYDSSDHLHPSAAGYGAMADAVDLSALRGSGC